jgi:hypothetical protein
MIAEPVAGQVIDEKALFRAELGTGLWYVTDTK